MAHPIRIATAGWSVPRAVAEAFTAEGSVLRRYASGLNAVEINTAFYRPHRRATYERWAADTPADFAFAVKAPRTMTHERRLRDCAVPMAAFLDEIAGLGGKLGPVLLQLPPSLAFDAPTAEAFLDLWRGRFGGATVLELRHASWFTDPVDALLTRFEIARVAADPALSPRAARPGGWPGLVYYRLHGSPVMYDSPYPPADLDTLAATLAATGRDAPAWCVFDNTRLGAAAADALALKARLPPISSSE
ncbi:MAG: hypothetical protein JWP92_3411 [Caulobacter sp.]|nr:hypothetical protein [Caulobacter sp.]